MSDTSLSPEEFGRAFQRFLDWLPSLPDDDKALAERLREHFEADPSFYPVTRLPFAEHDRPNLQVALDAYLAQPGRSAEVVGVTGVGPYTEATLAQLALSRTSKTFGPGPVGRTAVELKEGRQLACVTSGLFLVRDGERRLAVLVTQERFPMQSPLIEVMAPAAEPAEEFLVELRGLMTEHNVYRREVVSLSAERAMGGTRIHVAFHHRRRVTRDQIVLPAGLLERVERSTIEFDRHVSALRAAKRHLRRGLLLHGPPGTGKTLTATYLADALEERTVLVLTGPALELIRASCTMARTLQPAMVVLEDVDLVAEERTMMGKGATALLFELLNEIDGMEADADVIFLMTTNRAELLEPALAARPGRVDQAVEFPMPDAASRLRLLEVFCEGLDVESFPMDDIVERTEGVSPAYLREVVRRAAFHATAGGDGTVRRSHFEEALRDLEEGGKLTRTILGTGGDGTAPVVPPPARRSC